MLVKYFCSHWNSHWGKNQLFIQKLPKNWCWKNVNFVKNETLEMWILWEMRFWNCEFCEKWDFRNMNFEKNEISEIWILRKWDLRKVNFLKLGFSMCQFLDKMWISAPVWNCNLSSLISTGIWTRVVTKVVHKDIRFWILDKSGNKSRSSNYILAHPVSVCTCGCVQ